MPYCVVYGCTSNSSKDKNVHWFQFPTEQARFRAWVHYCKRENYTPSKHSRICGKHFTSSQYSRDPAKLAEYGYVGAKPALKDDAIPDVPLDVIEGSPVAKRPRTAFQKRRKEEVLQAAFDESRESVDSTISSEPSETNEICETATDDRNTVCTNTEEIEVASVKVQTDPVQQRTRRIQVSKNQKDKGVQCDLLQSSDIQQTVVQYEGNSCSTDTETQASDGESESDIDVDDSNSNYEPSDDEDDDSEEQEDSGDEWETENYRLESTDNPTEEKFYLVSESKLLELLSICQTCPGKCIPIMEYTKGTFICTSSICSNGHIWKWQSQSCHNRLPWANLLLSSAIMLSGNVTSKALRLFEHMKVKVPSARTIARLQGAYTIPAIIEEFDHKQAELMQELGDREVVIGGDGRCDSPGYSAKYGSYTLMDLDTNKILDVQLVQSNEVAGSTHMELEGLKRGLGYLTNNVHVNVKALVTDRHVMIKKYMRENHQNIHHFFDVWHIAKGISKKLEACAKKKNSQDIRPWIKSIVNHAYWVTASSGLDKNLKIQKWTSMTNHIMNKHEHESELFPRCLHGHLEGRAWLIEGSRSFKMVKGVIESPYLLRDLPQMSPMHQTYGLEVFHSVVNEFAPKSTHFFKYSMQARLYIAALHFNENGKRQQATTRDGNLIWKMTYPKAKKGTECVVKPKRLPPTFDYVDDLLSRIYNRRRMIDNIAEAQEDFNIVYAAPQPLTQSFVQFDKDELISSRSSRFNRLP